MLLLERLGTSFLQLVAIELRELTEDLLLVLHCNACPAVHHFQTEHADHPAGPSLDGRTFLVPAADLIMEDELET